MSIPDDIKARIRELEGGELHYFDAMADCRDLVLSSEVKEAIGRPFPTGREDRHAELLDTFDAWTEGKIFTVSENPDDKPRDTMLARTRPVGLGIWDIRCVDINRGVRCLGGFADKDIFVALFWDYREEISDFNEWVLDARREWDRLFWPLQPYSGGSLNDYLTNFYVLKEARRRRKNPGRS